MKIGTELQKIYYNGCSQCHGELGVQKGFFFCIRESCILYGVFQIGRTCIKHIPVTPIQGK